MPWTHVLIGPDPITIGERELEDVRQKLKKPMIGARRWNVSIATRRVTSRGTAPIKTKKERNQLKPGWLKLMPKKLKKFSKKEVF